MSYWLCDDILCVFLNEREREYGLLIAVLNLKCFLFYFLYLIYFIIYFEVFKFKFLLKLSVRLIIKFVLVKRVKMYGMFYFGFWIIKLNIIKYLFINMGFFYSVCC